VTKIRSISTKINIQARLANYAALSKFRLSSFVVLSSAIGFIIGSQSVSFDWIKFLLFTAGGTLVTFASNAINQLIEKDSDKFMTRTQNRPLPTSAMTQIDAVLFIGITSLAGILTLTFAVNATAGLLSALSLIIYGFIYTPLKKVSSIAVFVGAIPGALPPLLGYVAGTNELNHYAFWLFLVQFFWQFPHFWAIAWLSYEDYLKANIMLLPSRDGKSKVSAFITLIYTVVLIPLSLYPAYLKGYMTIGSGILLLASIGFTYLAFEFYRKCQDKDARKLMFGSFIYLLVFLISLFF
jgi:protoheme IX farnesyltransferase